MNGKILKSPVHQKRLRRFLNIPTNLIPQNEHSILSRKVGQADLNNTDGQRFDTEGIENIERVDEVNGPLDEPIVIDRCARVKNSTQCDVNAKTIGGGVSIKDGQVSKEDEKESSIEMTGHLINKNSDPLLEGSLSENKKGAEICLAEKIITSKSTKKGTFYRVRWANLDKNSDSWEPFENVCMDPVLLENFYKNELLKEKRAELRVRNKMANKIPVKQRPQS